MPWPIAGFFSDSESIQAQTALSAGAFAGKNCQEVRRHSAGLQSASVKAVGANSALSARDAFWGGCLCALGVLCARGVSGVVVSAPSAVSAREAFRGGCLCALSGLCARGVPGWLSLRPRRSLRERRSGVVVSAPSAVSAREAFRGGCLCVLGVLRARFFRSARDTNVRLIRGLHPSARIPPRYNKSRSRTAARGSR
jgi:hypothetical protein